MMSDFFNYPPVGFHFKVTFDVEGMEGETSFKEVSGLKAQMAYEEVKEGGLQKYRHRLPLGPKYSNLVLKRGLLPDANLHIWIKKCLEDFVFNPIDVTVELLNEEQEPLMSWVAVNALPVSWEIGHFDAMRNEYVMETLELSYDYFKF